MRIEAYNGDTGAVVHRFNTLRDAGRAGYTLSRISKAVATGQRHKGLRWRRVDGLHGLLRFIESETVVRLDTIKTWTIATGEVYKAFSASLPETERGISYAEFEAALAAAVRTLNLSRPPNEEWSYKSGEGLRHCVWRSPVHPASEDGRSPVHAVSEDGRSPVEITTKTLDDAAAA